MKKIFLPVFFSFLFYSSALATVKQPAPPMSALFYPNEVYLTVEEKIMPTLLPGKGKALFVTLPKNGGKDFSATVNGLPAPGFSWLRQEREVKATTVSEETNPDRMAILHKIETLKTKIDDTQAAIRTSEMRINFWQQRQPRKEELSPEDMVRLDAAFADTLPKLHAGLSRDKRDLETLRNELEKAQSSLREHDIEERDIVAIIPYDGPENQSAVVRYSYIIPGNYKTSYSLTAYPTKKSLKIVQKASLYQDSGMLWDNVDVFISTARRDTSVRPNPLAQWNIGVYTPGSPSAAEPATMERVANMSQISQSADMAKDKRVAPRPSPTQEEMGTFRIWKLGKRSVDSGTTVTLPLSTDEYEASYFYTLQPSQNPRGFLTAELNLEKALELPQGRARLFVDDVAVGEQNVSINGNKALVYFGTDPQVTATMRDLKRTRGEQGFINKEQSQLWHWEITVRNSRSRPVDVVVFDPIPQSTDTSIKLAVESKPKPESGKTAQQLGAVSAYTWKFALKPGEVQTIDHKVQLTAPADKKLTFGRRI